MKAYAFTGMPGAGKTEALLVAADMGIPVVSMGDEVRAEVARRGIPRSDETLGGIADEMRQKHGMDVWARRCLRHLPEAEVVVIDGIRNLEEVERFKEDIAEFVLVAIHTSPERRYGRLMNRRREDDGFDPSEVKHREERELAWGMGRVIAMADSIVTNDGDLQTFRKKISALLSRATGAGDTP
jgi:dephospho-CoA kinase